MGQVVNCILTFFYIFGFSFYKGQGLDSSILVAIYLFFCLLIRRSYSNRVIFFLKSVYFRNIVFVYLIINIYAMIVLMINASKDFSFLWTFFHMFILICIGILLYYYFVSYRCERQILNYIIIAFTVQSLIEWLAFLFPEIKAIVNYTKSAETIAQGQSYAGVRANALSGSDFFGLSAAYAIVFLLYWSQNNTLSRNSQVIKVMLYVILLSGTFFAGRTGYVGLVIAILYLFFLRVVRKRRRIALSWLDFLLGIIGGVIVFMGIMFFSKLYDNNENIYNLFNFTFQSIVNKRNDGSFNISSLDSLKNMYFEINPMTFLIGDGQYTTESGRYYMNTDVGYLRVILFMGIIGFFLLFLMQVFIIKPRLGKETLLKKMLVFLLLVLSLKGEVIVWGQSIVATVILFSLQNLDNKYNLKSQYGEKTI